jgi:hypothetical protein
MLTLVRDLLDRVCLTDQLFFQGEGMAGAIYYDPDSADDLDEEDPDEDLDL